MARASSTEDRLTHDVKLTDLDGNSVSLILCDRKGNLVPDLTAFPVPRQALKVNQGTSGYSNFEYPFSPLVQDNWGGGGGAKEFEKDTTKYMAGYRADTTRGNIIPGPKEFYATGFFSFININPDRVLTNDGYIPLNSTIQACSFVATSSAAFTKIKLMFALNTAPSPGTNTARVIIYQNSSGSPGSAIVTSASVTINNETKYVEFTISSTSLVSGTTYWLGVELTGSGTRGLAYGTSTAVMKYYSGGVWAASSYSPASFIFSLYSNKPGFSKLFEYKYQLYAILNQDTGGAPSIVMNGYRGMATSNAADLTKTNTTLNLSGKNLQGCFIRIVEGAGILESQPWRTITSNTSTGTNDSVYVDEPWNIAQDTSTHYVITGGNIYTGLDWFEVTATGTGPQNPVTDVEVTNDMVYMAQGDAGYIICMRYASGSHAYAADGTNKAQFLELIPGTDGKNYLWRTLANSLTISKGEPAAWSTPVTYSDITGGPKRPITGLTGYDVPTIPHVFERGGIGTVNNGIFSPYQLAEMENVASDFNGRVSIKEGSYLYFSFGRSGGFERFYNGIIDDMGPNRGDVGLLKNFRGPVSGAVSYAGKFYIIIDAGTEYNHYSTLQCYNGSGWCELYRSTPGKRLRGIHIQALENLDYQRLWLAEEEDMLWLPIALNPLESNGYPFVDTCYLESAYIYHDLRDVDKFWESMALFTENLDSSEVPSVELEYRVEGGDWTTCDGPDATPGYTKTSPKDTFLISTDDDVHGIRFQYRVTLNSTTYTPAVVEAVVVNGVIRVKPKSAYTIIFKITDDQTDLQGDKSNLKVDDILNTLEDWSDSEEEPCPLTLQMASKHFDDKRVFIEPFTLKVLDRQTTPAGPTTVLCQMTIYLVRR